MVTIKGGEYIRELICCSLTGGAVFIHIIAVLKEQKEVGQRERKKKVGTERNKGNSRFLVSLISVRLGLLFLVMDAINNGRNQNRGVGKCWFLY